MLDTHSISMHLRGRGLSEGSGGVGTGGDVQVRVSPSAPTFWESLGGEKDADDDDSAADIVAQGWIRDILVSARQNFL